MGLNMVILGVTFAMVFSNITTGAAWTGYQRLLGADSMALGVISAIPVAASALQLLASYVLEKRQNRRTLFLIFGLISRIAWGLMALIPVCFPAENATLRLFALMALLCVSSIGSSFQNVAFYSLIGDLVPMRIRGRYFSARQAVSLLAGILAGLFVSWLMDSVRSSAAYITVLAIAGIFGTADICCFFFFKWPPMAKREGKKESFVSMLRGVLSDKPYMRIVGYFTLWCFSANIMAPFTNVFLLEEAGMSFTEVTLLVQILPNIATVLVIAWWGRQMDRYGNQPIVQTSGLYCMLFPLAYVLAGPGAFFFLSLANIFSGMASPASDLGQQNMYLERAPQRNRSMYVAVFFACTQLFGTALCNFVGGALMSGPLPALEGLRLSLMGHSLTRYSYLFILCSVLRMACVLLLLPRLRGETDTPAGQMVLTIGGQWKEKSALALRGIRVKRIRTKYRKEHPPAPDGDAPQA